MDLQLGDAQALAFADRELRHGYVHPGAVARSRRRRRGGEARRVPAPRRALRALEHVRSPRRSSARRQRLLEPLALRFEDDYLTREPLEHLTAAGSRSRSSNAQVGIVERRRRAQAA